MELPKEEYTHVKKDGKTFTFCTLRQKVLHTIGLNSSGVKRRLYKRHGKKYYKPYRNYFTGNDKELDALVAEGYMECDDDPKMRTYWFNRCGLDWLGEQIGVIIKDEEQ